MDYWRRPVGTNLYWYHLPQAQENLLLLPIMLKRIISIAHGIPSTNLTMIYFNSHHIINMLDFDLKNTVPAPKSKQVNLLSQREMEVLSLVSQGYSG